MTDKNQQLATQEKPQKASLQAGGGGVDAIIPRDVEQAYRLSKMIVSSGLAPSDAKTPDEVMGRIVAGMEIGLKPLQAVQSIALVNGRPVVWGDALIALVRGSGLCEYVSEWIEGEGDQLAAICETKRVGEPHETRRSFSIADAKQANLLGKSGPWKQYPKRMLQMRARSWALRDTYADVLKGIAVAEEQRDAEYYDRAARAPQGGEAPNRGAQILQRAQKSSAETVEHDPATGVVEDAEEVETPAPEPDQPRDWQAEVSQLCAQIDASETSEQVGKLMQEHDEWMSQLWEADPDLADETKSHAIQRQQALQGDKATLV